MGALGHAFLELNLRWAGALVERALSSVGAADAPGVAVTSGDVLGRLEASLEHLAHGAPLPFFELAARLRLSPLETQIMGLCLARLVDPALGERLARLPGHGGDPRLLVADVAALFFAGDPDARVRALDVVSPRAQLVASCVLAPIEPAWDGLLATPLALGRPCAAHLLGDAFASPVYRYLPASSLAPTTRVVLPGAACDSVYETVAGYAAAQRSGASDLSTALLLFFGPSGSGRASFARELARDLFDGLVEVDAEVVRDAPEPLALLREAFGCATLHGSALLVTSGEALLERGTAARAFLAECRRAPGCVIVTASRRELHPSLEAEWLLATRFAPPDRLDGASVWRAHLADVATPDDVPAPDLASLAERYQLAPVAVARAARLARLAAHNAHASTPTDEMLSRAAALQIDDDMGALVRTVHPRHHLDDLVLPPEERRQIAEIVDATRSWHHVMGGWGLGRRLASGKCLSCLFAGPPGTGKTFAAEIIAGTVGEALHVVSLPNILSKWMGESERNIHDLFARAQEKSAVLLFDEADALFASRVEVRSSQDQAMNMMTGLLLQEIDRHQGLVILTTNHDDNIDHAFQRRILYTVRFPRPDAAARLDIWRRLLPAELPRDPGLDLASFAEDFELSGGEIKNAVVRAALRAYADGGALGARHLVDACEQEYGHTGRLLVRGASSSVEA